MLINKMKQQKQQKFCAKCGLATYMEHTGKDCERKITEIKETFKDTEEQYNKQLDLDSQLR